jgi:PAS domain S-box-containing protein
MSKYAVESSTGVILDLSEKTHVLHVDDDLGILKVTKQCLEMEGPIHVDMALSVDEALAKLERERYDVVVSDYQMPGKDGLDFLKELREKGSTIPFIMFTGKGREEVAIKALNLGANRYLNKTGETETVYMELTHSITELAKIRRTEERLRESEEKFRNLFEKANDGLVFVDLSGRIADANQKAAEIAGKKKEDIVGKSFLELSLVKPCDVSTLFERFRKSAMEKLTSSFEIEISREKGEKRLIEINSTVLRNNNLPIGFLAIVRDITERKKAEESLKGARDELQRFSAAVKASVDGIVMSDLEGRIVELNDSALRLYGANERNDLVGKNSLDLVAPEERERITENMKEVMIKGFADKKEINIITKGSLLLPVEITTTLVKDAEGHNVGFLGIVRDIAERKEAEKALKESEAKYRTLVEQSLQGIVIAQGIPIRLVFANSAMATITGYSPDELTSLSPKQIEDLVHPDDRELFFGRFKDRLHGKAAPSHYEFRGIRKDGTVILAEISSSRIEYKGQPAVQATFMDISDRKRARQKQ